MGESELEGGSVWGDPII